MNTIKEKSPALLARQTGHWIEIKRGALLSINKITHPSPQVKNQTGGVYAIL